MIEILEFLRSIPNVIWSGVIASTLTLGGVLIANRSNATRLKLQLKHDAAEKAKERTFNLRREVYLNTSEELSRANSKLSSLPQKDPVKGNAADIFQDFFASAAKLQLVAETKTALLVNELAATYSSMVLRVMERASPLQLIYSQIAKYDELYHKAQGEVSRVLAELARFNEEANTDKVVFEALNGSFEGFQTQATRHAEKRSECWDEYNSLNAEFARMILIEMKETGATQIPVLVEIRRELGLDTDIDAYKAQLEDLWKRMYSQIDEMIERMNKG